MFISTPSAHGVYFGDRGSGEVVVAVSCWGKPGGCSQQAFLPRYEALAFLVQPSLCACRSGRIYVPRLADLQARQGETLLVCQSNECSNQLVVASNSAIALYPAHYIIFCSCPRPERARMMPIELRDRGVRY